MTTNHPPATPVPNPDAKLVSAAATRNTIPILDELKRLLADRSGTVLEIGSGSGQHIPHWAEAMPALTWQPSDPFEHHHQSIRSYAHETAAANLRDPVWLDAAEAWPDLGPLTAVISVNVIHIAPWVVAQGLVRGAVPALARGGLLIFYGPFKENGVHTGEGNAAFDAKLQAEDPSWGIRDLEDVTELAQFGGLAGPEITQMPANNRLIVFRK